jgi:hypothetical protein
MNTSVLTRGPVIAVAVAVDKSGTGLPSSAIRVNPSTVAEVPIR